MPRVAGCSISPYNPIFDKRVIVTNGYVSSEGSIEQWGEAVNHNPTYNLFNVQRHRGVTIDARDPDIPNNTVPFTSSGCAGQISRLRPNSIVCRGFTDGYINHSETALGQAVSNNLSLFNLRFIIYHKADIHIEGIFDGELEERDIALVKIANTQDQTHPLVYHENTFDNMNNGDFSSSALLEKGEYILTAVAVCDISGLDVERNSRFRFVIEFA